MKIKHEWLKQKRLENKWSVEYVASECKCCASTISKIERGERTPSVDLAKRLGKLFGFDWWSLWQ